MVNGWFTNYFYKQGSSNAMNNIYFSLVECIFVLPYTTVVNHQTLNFNDSAFLWSFNNLSTHILNRIIKTL